MAFTSSVTRGAVLSDPGVRGSPADGGPGDLFGSERRPAAGPRSHCKWSNPYFSQVSVLIKLCDNM